MSIRDAINKYPAALAVAAVLALLIAGTVIYFQFFASRPGTPRAVYFFDLETREVFERPPGTTPPVAAPSGGVGVRAHLYSCGDCHPDEWFGYLETFRDRAQRGDEREAAAAYREEDHLVRDLDNGNWVPYFSAAGDRLRDHVEQPCPGDHELTPRLCLP